MAARLDLTDPARKDIAAVLAYSRAEFGRAAEMRYERLLEQGFLDLLADPERPGVKTVAGDPLAFIYHLRHSARRVRPVSLRVREPRHLVAFIRPQAEVIHVVRILHDSMDLPRHLDPGYLTD